LHSSPLEHKYVNPAKALVGEAAPERPATVEIDASVPSAQEDRNVGEGSRPRSEVRTLPLIQVGSAIPETVGVRYHAPPALGARASRGDVLRHPLRRRPRHLISPWKTNIYPGQNCVRSLGPAGSVGVLC